MNERPSPVEPSPSDDWVAREARGDEVLDRLISEREELYGRANAPGNTSGYLSSLDYPTVPQSQLQLRHEAIAARKRQLDREEKMRDQQA